MATLTFNNQSQGTSYVVLEIKPNSLSVIPSLTPKYFLNTSLSNFTNTSRKMMVISDYKLGIVVPKGNSSFDFSPSVTISNGISTIRGTGECNVEFNNGNETLYITSEELHGRVNLPEIQGGGAPPSPIYNNPFCFEFNGNSDSVKVAGSTTTLELYNEISISTWITIDADVFNTGSGEKDYYIVDKLKFIGPTVEGYALYIKRTSNSVKLRGVFGVENNTIFQCTTQTNIEAGAVNALAPNTPHNIVVTYNPGLGTFGRGRIKTYLNGAVIPSSTKNISNVGTFRPANSENFIIGNASVSGTGPGVKEYHGKIDEVSIWDTELQQSDVTALYDWNTNGNLKNYLKSDNLVGWYRMGENATFDAGSGNWTLRSATNVNDNTLYLTSNGVAQTDLKTPGLVGPA